MARLVGLEPTTSASAGLRSNPLSYRRPHENRGEPGKKLKNAEGEI